MRLRRAERLFEEGKFVAAAELADAELREHPEDAEARALRDRARERALASLLDETQDLLARGKVDAAATRLAQLLGKRAAWQMRLDDQRERALSAAVQASRANVEAEIAGHIERGHVLSAERALARHDGLLAFPELGTTGAEARRRVLEAGVRSCRGFEERTAAEGPAWQLLLARYCAHFGAESAQAPERPGWGGIEPNPAVAGVAPEQQARLVAGLEQAFRTTPWFVEGAAARARVEAAGSHEATFRARNVTIDAPWTERVAYTVLEHQRVPHQVSYTDWERYSVSVPYTDYVTESYSCGYGTSYRTCTRSRSVTRYRTEYRSRPVTRFRTEYRSELRPVTHYRHEPRVHRYAAIEHQASYATVIAARVLIDPGQQIAAARSDRVATQTGLEHDESFPAAGVEPTRPRLPTSDAWLAGAEAELAGRLRDELVRSFVDRFCSPATPDLEQASSCVRARTSLPAPARARLASVVGEPEVDLFVALVAR